MATHRPGGAFALRCFRLKIENVTDVGTAHEVLAVVFQVRLLDGKKPQLSVLLWERAMEPQRGAWSLPGGQLRHV